MFKREMKVNFKNFLVWTGVLIAIYLVVFLMYPSIIAREEMGNLDEMMKMFPPEVLKAFNMDISSIDTAYGWLKTEGFVFILLITGCYAGITGSTILLKEESEKTIEYLASLPIRRRDIVLKKYLAGTIYVVAITVAIGLFNYVGLCLSGDFDQKQYILLAITPIFSSVVTFSMCMFVSTFAKKTKKMFGVSLGIVFICYFLNMISELSDNTEWLKYISTFTLADVRNVIMDVKINPVFVVTSILLSLVFLGLTLYRYEKKELV